MAIQTTDHAVQIAGLKEDIRLMSRQILAIDIFSGNSVMAIGYEEMTDDEAWETIWSPEFNEMVPTGTINKRAYLVDKAEKNYLQIYALEVQNLELADLADQLDFMESYEPAVADSLSDDVSHERWEEALEIICRSDEIFPTLTRDRKSYLEKKIEIVRTEIEKR